MSGLPVQSFPCRTGHIVHAKGYKPPVLCHHMYMAAPHPLKVQRVYILKGHARYGKTVAQTTHGKEGFRVAFLRLRHRKGGRISPMVGHKISGTMGLYFVCHVPLWHAIPDMIARELGSPLGSLQILSRNLL